ncbi:hypothetical protein GWK36_06225 [Caldichromatium japonicum]|uniref:SPOR domain-containing protein n=1 Tax=Caldichromatium japonicum TaxID=2699430 RepID=A0A6G7VCN4_9GAMM|nr:hypothetical protein [Caldichromatium japonicum]QIK37645.1 hypothetical protein GWK36_06225 [Caldichromatium japonicum]
METPDSVRMDSVRMETAPSHHPKSQATLTDVRPNPALVRYLKILADRLLQLNAELKQSRQELETLERDLISRLADVDDERRRGETRVQRLLRSQRDELDASLQGQRIFIAMLLFLISLLVGSGLAFVLLRLQDSHQSLEAQITDLRKAITQINLNASVTNDPKTRDQIERLSQALTQISNGLERRGDFTPDLNLDLTPATRPALLSDATPPPPATLAPSQPLATGTAMAEDSVALVADASPPLGPAATEPGSPLPPPEDQIEHMAAHDAEVAPNSLDETPTAASTSAQTEAADRSGRADRQMPGDVSSAPGESAQGGQIQPPGDETVPTSPPLPDQSAPSGTASPGALPAKSPLRLARRIEIGNRTFCLQLIGFSTLQALERFVADNPFPMVYYYREETYQGRPWFVLIHSLHETRESAESAVASLPPPLARLNLWVRRLKPETELIEVQRLAP